jgi:hypothetical protein
VGQDKTEPRSSREWIRSYLEVMSQGTLKSSISKRALRGVHSGWMGEMSIPFTSALG